MIVGSVLKNWLCLSRFGTIVQNGDEQKSVVWLLCWSNLNSVCLSVCPCLSQSVCLFVCVSVSVSFYVSLSVSACPPVCLSACLSLCLSLSVSVCPSARLPASSFFRPSGPRWGTADAEINVPSIEIPELPKVLP